MVVAIDLGKAHWHREDGEVKEEEDVKDVKIKKKKQTDTHRKDRPKRKCGQLCRQLSTARMEMHNEFIVATVGVVSTYC